MHCFITCVCFDIVSLVADQSRLPCPAITLPLKQAGAQGGLQPEAPTSALSQTWNDL